MVWPAMIIGTAWLIRRVRRHTRAQATSSKTPYVVVLALVAAVSFAVSLAVTYMMPAVAFFALHTRAWQLAVGGLVALTAGQWRRLPATYAAIAGWGGLALILLACTRLSTATFYPGTAALLPVLGTALVIGAGCAAPSVAIRPRPGLAADAGDRPGCRTRRYLWHWPVLLFVPLLLGHPLGLAGRLAAAVVSGGLAVLTLHLIENPLRFAARVRQSPIGSLALGGAATAVAVCVGVALLVWVPTPVGRGPAAAALTMTAAPPPTGYNIDAYDAAVQHAFAQVQAAVTASAELKAVWSILNPRWPTRQPNSRRLFNGCLRAPFQGGS